MRKVQCVEQDRRDEGKSRAIFYINLDTDTLLIVLNSKDKTRKCGLGARP